MPVYFFKTNQTPQRRKTEVYVWILAKYNGASSSQKPLLGDSVLEPFSVTLERTNTQKTVKAHKKALEYFKARALGGTRGTSQGWKIVNIKEYEPEQKGAGWKFSFSLEFKKTRGNVNNEDTVIKQWTNIVDVLTKAANGTKWQNRPWQLSFNKDNGDDAIINDKAELQGKLPENNKPEVEEGVGGKHGVKNVKTKQFAQLQPKWDGVFDRIYHLPHQIELLTASIDTAVETNYQVRGHCLLLGPPSCGKTTVAETAVRSLGEEDVAYFRLDATSTTKAGIERKLLDSDLLPPIMVIEELEKVENIGILKFLLGLLDDRAEINKMNAKIGHRRRELRLFCIATVNDLQKLKDSHAGAVASRFTNQINFPKPNKDTIRQILHREIKEEYGDQGNLDWAEKTIEYVCEEENCYDTRRAISVCLVGRNKLLDGSYQKALRATKPTEWI